MRAPGTLLAGSLLSVILAAGLPVAAAEPSGEAPLIPVGVLPELPADAIIADVASTGLGWIAVGSDVGAAQRGPGPEMGAAILLASSDGLVWSRIELGADAAAGTMGWVGDTVGSVLILGAATCPSFPASSTAPAASCPAVWRSDDLETWTRSVAEENDVVGTMFHQAAILGPDSAVAIGCPPEGCTQPSAVSRSDGFLRWETLPTSGLPDALLLGIASDGTTLVVTGLDLSDGTAVIGTSTIGGDWSTTPIGGPGAGLEFVTAGPDHWLAGGQRRDPANGAVTGLVVTSRDALAWDAVAAAAAPDLFFRDGVSDPWTILVGSAPSSAGHRPAAWRLDAAGLTEIAVSGLDPAVQGELLHVAAAPDGTVVATGYLDEPTGLRWAMWALAPGAAG